MCKDQHWLILDIDSDGMITRRAKNNPIPKSGDTHFHVMNRQILSIHAQAQHEDLTMEVLAYYWTLVKSEQIVLDRERNGESYYDIPLLEMICIMNEQV